MPNIQDHPMLKRSEVYLAAFLLAFALLVHGMSGTFLTASNLLDLARTSSGFSIVALGVFIALLSGGLDVSFFAVAISGQYIALNVLIAADIDSLFLGFLISCSVGATLGFVNGFLISKFKLPTLITTLGTLSVFHGLLLTFVGSHGINSADMPESFIRFSRANLFTFTTASGETHGLSVFVGIAAAVYLVSWLLLRYTVLGRSVLVIGGNVESAHRTGLNVRRIQLFVYTYVGFLAGMTGIISGSMLRFVAPTMLVGRELDVIAAVVLGGAKITGGKGTIIGTILGVLIFKVLETSLVLVGLSSLWHRFFVGIIILVGVSITAYQTKRHRAKNLIFLLD
jgi:simple sugar transport system permease protein